MPSVTIRNNSTGEIKVIAPTELTQYGLQMPTSTSRVAEASKSAIQSGANPEIVAAAKDYLGNKDFIGWCEKLVRMATGRAERFSSAIKAWQGQQDKAIKGVEGIKPGDAIYFTANKSNKGYGHTGIYAGDGEFISATNNGVEQRDVKDWAIRTGQRILGYVPQG